MLSKRLIKKILPSFMVDYTKTQTDETLFNYRRIWIAAVIGTAIVSLLPLIFMAGWNIFQFMKAINAEKKLPFFNLVSHANQTISMYLDERKSTLRFILEDSSFEELSDPARLSQILHNLKIAIGDVVDIGLITSDGNLKIYEGPYKLVGKNYKDEYWFHEVMLRGVYISEVFLGFRDFPHIVIAAKQEIKNGDFYVLRITLDTQKFNSVIKDNTNVSNKDVFLVNSKGVIQTPSRFYGNVLEELSFSLPKFVKVNDITEINDGEGQKILLGYSLIDGTSFILLVIELSPKILNIHEPFLSGILGFLIISILIVLAVIFRVSTTMVKRIEETDRKRVMFLHKIEHTNKMASIGRLAAGVAHEINNPLAIINQKAGLLKDICDLNDKLDNKEQFIKIADSILNSVDRCGKITYRLLGFAKHIDVQLESLDPKVLIEEVLGFLEKEAEYRNIEINLKTDPEVPAMYSDRGRLQQVFINIVNNAMAAVPNGGHIEIEIQLLESEKISISVKDDGVGIKPEHLKNIFEPFFTTK
ncbi:two-component sensor histidine kinase, partial [bacterium]|nr:two-component sensor histidine kinase [bacterium]